MDGQHNGLIPASDLGVSGSDGRRKRRRIPEESRKRVARACDECRKMKERCQGGRPCERCARLGRSCDTSEVPRLPKNKSNDFDGFFDVERIRYLEQIVAHFTGITTYDKSQLMPIVSSLIHHGSDVQPSSSYATPNNTTGVTSEDEEFTISAVSPTTTLYSGELSHANFSIRVKQKVDSQLNATSIENKPRDADKKDSPKATQLHAQSSMVHNVTASLPPAEVGYFLLEVFFSFAQTNYSYVDEYSMRQRLENFYVSSPTLELSDAPWICTVLMMFAIGTQFAHMSEEPNDRNPGQSNTRQDNAHSPDDDVALSFYHSASKLIPDVIAAASIDSVQAFILLGVYALPIDAAGLSHTYFGIAIRIAIQNGLHRRYYQNLDPRQVELRNRLWWTTYSIERRISILHGRPVSITRSEVYTDLPTDFPNLRPSTRVENLQNVLAMIKLTDALEDARDKLLSLKKASGRLKPIILSSILQLKRELCQYWESLPDLTFCRDLAPNKPLFRFNIHLALSYHLIHIFLGRSFILNRTGANGLEVPPEQDRAGWMETCNALVTECIESAEAVIDLCQILHDEVGLARASYTEFTCCCAALIAVMAQRISAAPSSISLQNCCDKGLKLMKQMSVGLYSADSDKFAIEALETAVDRLGRSGQKKMSGSTSKSAYAQFRNWAVFRQIEPRERDAPNYLENPGDSDPILASCNMDIPSSVQWTLPENTEEHVNSAGTPFELAELASIPGLDQWFEYGLL